MTIPGVATEWARKVQRKAQCRVLPVFGGGSNSGRTKAGGSGSRVSPCHGELNDGNGGMESGERSDAEDVQVDKCRQP